VNPAKEPAADDNGVLVAPDDNGVPHLEEAYGEMGKPVVLGNVSADIKKLMDEGYQKNAFNQYASDLISVHRSLPDPRDAW